MGWRLRGGTDQILVGLIADAVGVSPKRVNYIGVPIYEQHGARRDNFRDRRALVAVAPEVVSGTTLPGFRADDVDGFGLRLSFL